MEVFLARHDAGLNKLHHKLAVIDDEVVISGSFNYTGPATALNDENVVVIGDVDEPPGDGQDRQRQLQVRLHAPVGEAVPPLVVPGRSKHGPGGVLHRHGRASHLP